MLILLIGSLAGDLGRAAQAAVKAGVRLCQVATIEAAIAQASKAEAALLLVELPCNVRELSVRIAEHGLQLPIVACATDGRRYDDAADELSGAQALLRLPEDLERLSGLLQTGRGVPEPVIACDQAMLVMLSRADRVAQSDATILITGESGSGKEVIARRLHRFSRRSHGPFVALNCAAIPENLLESELFGHERGAFSGAVARRAGKFELAEGGTLLLDEISEMDVRLQAKLLRVLQEREIDRLGGTAPLKVDVRVLATSNRDLPAEVAAGRFRADLYYRLNVVSLVVPPLRSRPADLPVLADHYAARFAQTNAQPYRPISLEAHRKIAQHTWPGNVRELENTIHRAVLISSQAVIDSDAIELSSTEHHAAPVEAAPQIGRTMGDVERQHILDTLSALAGNRTHTATALGISIRALRNKLRDYTRAGTPVPPPGMTYAG